MKSMKKETLQLNAGGFNEHMVMIWATQVAPRQFAEGNVEGVKKFMESKYFQAYKHTIEGSKLLLKINEWLDKQLSAGISPPTGGEKEGVTP